MTEATENNAEPEVELTSYVIFRKGGDWSIFDATHFEVHSTGTLLFYAKDALTGVSNIENVIDVMKKSDLNEDALIEWGIKERPPHIEGKFVVTSKGRKLSAWDLLNERKVAWEDIEQTSDGWKVVYFDVAQDKEVSLGEFDYLNDAVIALYKAQNPEVVDKTKETFTVTEPVPVEDVDGYRLPTDAPIDVKMIEVWVKLGDNTVEKGWLHEGDFLTDGWFFRRKFYKPVIGWKYRERK